MNDLPSVMYVPASEWGRFSASVQYTKDHAALMGFIRNCPGSTSPCNRVAALGYVAGMRYQMKHLRCVRDKVEHRRTAVIQFTWPKSRFFAKFQNAVMGSQKAQNVSRRVHFRLYCTTVVRAIDHG